MFSFCNVSGLFILSNGSRTLTDADLQEPAKWQGDDTDRASYVFYDTVISCSENAPLLANLRVSSSLSESILPDGTAAFVLGDAFVRTSENVSFIDAKHLKAFNAEASSFFPPFAPFYTTHISSLGTICGETKVLEDGSNFFPVAVSVNFKNDITSFKLACLYNGDEKGSSESPKPRPGTTVQFSGICTRVLPSGLLAVKVDDITFCLPGQRLSRPRGFIHVAHHMRAINGHLKDCPLSSLKA